MSETAWLFLAIGGGALVLGALGFWVVCEVMRRHDELQVWGEDYHSGEESGQSDRFMARLSSEADVVAAERSRFMARLSSDRDVVRADRDRFMARLSSDRDVVRAELKASRRAGGDAVVDSEGVECFLGGRCTRTGDAPGMRCLNCPELREQRLDYRPWLDD